MAIYLTTIADRTGRPEGITHLQTGEGWCHTFHWYDDEVFNLAQPLYADV